MTTRIYKNYSEFKNRKDKTENGVSESFAKAYENYAQENLTNRGCWNCIRCDGCVDCYCCYRCTDCTDCVGCNRCDDCTRCVNCAGCYRCYDCTECTDCRDFLDRYKVNCSTGGDKS